MHRKIISGIVRIEIKVVINTVFEANSSFPPYSVANRSELFAVGIIKRIKVIPKVNGVFIKYFNMGHNSNGSISCLHIAKIYTLKSLKIDLMSIFARLAPISSIATGLVTLPSILHAPDIKEGTVICEK